MPHSLQWRIAISYTLLIFLAMGLVSLFLFNYIQRSYLKQVYSHLHHNSDLLAQIISSDAGRTDKEAFIDFLSSYDVVSQTDDGKTNYKALFFDLDGGLMEAGVIPDREEWMDIHSNKLVHIGKSYQGKLDSHLGEILYSVSPIVDHGVLSGSVMTYVLSKTVKGYINLIVTTVLVSGLIVGVLSIALSVYIARRTGRLIGVLTSGVKRIEEGDLDHRVSSLARDETADLAAAFNRMAQTVSTTVENLSGERDTLSAVLDTMGDGVITLDGEGSITLFNQTASELFNTSPVDAIGMRLAEVIRDFEILQLASTSSDSGSILQSEVEVPEVRRFLSVIATPLGPDGERGVLLTIHDLTNIRQMETSRKEFVSNVSHELRSPIASIKAMADTLGDGAIQDSRVALDFIGRISKDVERMAIMVDDLLELSRIEGGQEVLNIRPVNLRHVSEDAIVHVKNQGSGHFPEIIVKINEGRIVAAQEEKLFQIMVNLIQNSLKFTDADGRIVVSAKLSVDRFIEISVMDTGLGIPSEHLPHVFERFYKVDRSRRDGGTGLGLAIVKHLVQAHGGNISVESVEGEGSVFTFTIPSA